MADYAWVAASCPVCGGDKTVSDPSCSGNGFRGWGGDICRRCHGTGRVTCPRCDGKGTIEKSERVSW